MTFRLPVRRQTLVAAALGTAQTVSWGSSYYLPAVLAAPMAATFDIRPVWVFAAFSLALVISAAVGPFAGARIDVRGGRGVLVLSNLVMAAGLVLMSAAEAPWVLVLGWGVLGVGMGSGLYEAAFATLTRIYGTAARGPITGVTLIAGFASTVGWPLTGLLLTGWGWQGACLGWAVLHLGLALPLNLLLPDGQSRAPAPKTGAPDDVAPTRAMALLACVFAAGWFTSTAMAAHLPALLQAAGASLTTAIAAGALIGPAQVAARVLEFGLLRRFHPLVSARIAATAHPLAALVLAVVGAPGAAAFALLHGAGNGIMTIAQGTLPLSLFGAAGYGRRLGWLNAPARLLQAAAPLIFGAALAAWGLGALWLTAGLSLAAGVALFTLRRPRNHRM